MPSAEYAVLLVEDEPLIRMNMNDALTSAGFHIIEAANACEAMAILDARLDVMCVVSDVAMPGEMNGLSLAWEMRRRWPTVALILSTGKGLPSPAMVPDGTTLLQKPYPLGELVSAVNAAIAAHRPDDVAWRDNVVPLRSRDDPSG
jgi:DNA-binding NtrC family response regulator